MRHTDLSPADFLGVLDAAWVTFSALCKQAETDTFNPCVVVFRPNDAQLLVLQPPPAAMPGLLKALVTASRAVPMLCTEMWSSAAASEEQNAPVREREGAVSAIAVIAQFTDGVIVVSGRLSHDEPAPGVVRTVLDVETVGVPVAHISGRMIAVSRDPSWQ